MAIRLETLNLFQIIHLKLVSKLIGGRKYTMQLQSHASFYIYNTKFEQLLISFRRFAKAISKFISGGSLTGLKLIQISSSRPKACDKKLSS